MPNLRAMPWKSYLSDIRFWIAIFFIVRLYGITNPPLDPSTLWRQSDVLMIARNFYETDPNIFFPRIDVSETPDGTITGVEFPLYNYLIYFFSLFLDYDHWYGRLINLIISSIGIFYFFRVVKRYYSEEIAFTSALLLLASAWFAYSRTTFPDIFGASLNIVALYYCFAFFEQGKKTYLTIYFLLAMLGSLSKISALSFFAVLVLPIMSPQFAIQRKMIVLVASSVILIIVSAWYFYWVPHLNSIGRSYFSMGFPMSMGINDILDEPLKFIKKFYDDPLKYTGSVAVLLAVFYSINTRKFTLLYAPLLVLAAYFIIILKSGKWFYINGYYFVMYVPAIALLAAIGLSYLPRKSMMVFLIIIMIENISNQVHVFRVRDSYQFYTKLESAFDEIGASRHDLIIVGCDECSSTPIYMSHRKGVILQKEQLENKAEITRLKNKGFNYILLQKRLHGLDLKLPYELLIDEIDFSIYKL